MPAILKRVGQWGRALRILASGRKVRAAIRRAEMQEGHFLAGKIIEKITGGGFEPHAKVTRLIRRGQGFGGGKILIVSGTLVGSVVAVRVGGVVFAGVRRGRTTSSGKDVVDVAAYHELGKNYRATERQKRFIFAMIRKSGGYDDDVAADSGGMQIKIPPRPFVGPIEKAYGPGIARRIRKRFARLTFGDLGS